MDNNKKHLRISNDRIRREPIKKSGFGKAYLRENYQEHGERILKEFRSATEAVFERKDSEILDKLIFQVSTPSTEKAKSHSTKMKDLGMEIISYSSETSSNAIVAVRKGDLSKLENRIENYAEKETHPGKTNLSVIEKILEVPIYEKLLIEDNINNDNLSFVISIYTIFNREEKEIIAAKIFQELSLEGATKLQLLRFSDGSFTISGYSNLITLRKVGQEFYSINAILPNRQFITKKSQEGDKIPNPINIDPPGNVKVVIIDSGIDTKCTPLDGLILDRLDFPPPDSIKPDTEHGTLVASRVIFGDDILSAIRNGSLTPACSVIDVNVFGTDVKVESLGHTEVELAHIIDSITPGISKESIIFNLSLGAAIPAQDGKYSILSKRLDYLAYKYKVLFIIAAGNIDPNLYIVDFPNHFSDPNSRIQPPAEALLALSVGSIAKFSDGGSLSKVNEVSPFSCIGPGVDTGVKPDIVAHGGNFYLSPRTAAYGLHSNGTSFAYDFGTSYSAPIISHYAAVILNENQNFSAIMLKAILIHFTEKRNSPLLLNLKNSEFVGHGEPILENCLVPSNYSVAYLFESTLDTNNYHFVPFHIPPCFSEDGEKQLIIRVTLVYDPSVNLNNNAEYSQSKITIQILKNNSGAFSELNFSARDYKFSCHWNPVLKFEKQVTRNYSSGEWAIRLRCSSRGDVEENFSQSYALVIEIIDPTSKLPVYNDVMKNWGEIYNPSEAKKATA